MKFNKIVTVNFCGLTGRSTEKIFALSALPIQIHDNDPQTEAEIIERIGDADCVLVSWRTKISAAILEACPSIKYIGMCCSLYDEAAANVDVITARKKGIVVKGVKDYGDDGTLEFIFAELIALCKGLRGCQWGAEPNELTSKTLGIVGLGFLGNMVAQAALLFGMNVIYYSRTRKPEVEQRGVEYRTFEDLLTESDIVTLHLPRNVQPFTSKEFSLMKKDAIFVNTSLGQPFENDAFFQWIAAQTGNYAIFDLPGSGSITEQCSNYPNIMLYRRPSGFTFEAKGRLTDKILENMRSFLTQK